MSYRNILVISDNSYLCNEVSELFKNKKIQNCFVTFSISPFSDINSFKLNSDVEVKILNLKDSNDISYIKSNYDLILSIHCKQIFPKELVNNIKCINIHPGYNPINRGWYPQVFSIINKLDIGATIHEIDNELDHGPIIARAFVTKSNIDTSESLYSKILTKEIELLDKHLINIINNTYKTIIPEDEGNLFLKSDFKELLELDLNEQVLVGDFIDKLRALTHGKFNNAFYIDPDTGQKIFIGIKLKAEKDE